MNKKDLIASWWKRIKVHLKFLSQNGETLGGLEFLYRIPCLGWSTNICRKKVNMFDPVYGTSFAFSTYALISWNIVKTLNCSVGLLVLASWQTVTRFILASKYLTPSYFYLFFNLFNYMHNYLYKKMDQICSFLIHVFQYFAFI